MAENPEIRIPQQLEQKVRDADENNIITEEGRLEVETFLATFAEKLSATEYKQLTPTEFIKHDIQVTNETPIRLKCRPVPQAKKEVLKNKITELLEAGLIRRSFSPWRSPVHLVSKEGKDDRLKIDYRALNAVTVKDSYPIPNIRELLMERLGSKWFSIIDLIAAYYQTLNEEM